MTKKVGLSAVLSPAFVVVQDTSWSTIHTSGLRLKWHTTRSSFFLVSNLHGATVAQYYKGNFEKRGTARRMDIQ